MNSSSSNDALLSPEVQAAINALVRREKALELLRDIRWIHERSDRFRKYMSHREPNYSVNQRVRCIEDVFWGACAACGALDITGFFTAGPGPN